MKTFTIKNHTVIATMAGVALLFLTAGVKADTTDELLKVLRDKGVLNQQEYDTFNAARDSEKAKKMDALKVKFKDGFKIESADKQHSISANGRVMLDYRNFGGGHVETNTADTFDVRRAFITLKGQMYNDYKWEVTWDGASNSLNQAFINIGWWDAANIKLGQFKMPMSIDQQTSSRFIDFQERSMMDSLIPAREIGIMIHGTPLNGVYYALAASNGEGANKDNVDNTNDGSDFIGRTHINLAKILGVKNAIYHLGAAYSNGSPGATGSFTAPGPNRESRTNLRPFRSANFTGTTERTRIALESILAYNNFKLQAEWLNYNLEGASATGTNFDRDIDAWYIDANWLITGEHYADSYKKSGAFDRIRPRNDFIHPNATASGWGAWEAGLRYSAFDASDFKTSNAVGTGVLIAGATNRIDAWTAQLKWILNPNMRWMINYIRTDFNQDIIVNGLTIDHENAIITRLQFDF